MPLVWVRLDGRASVSDFREFSREMPGLDFRDGDVSTPSTSSSDVLRDYGVLRV